MTCDTVNLDVLFLEQDVVTELQHSDGSVELGAHEVGKRELVVGRTNKERTALGKTCDRLTRDIVVSHESTAVGIAFEGCVEEGGVELIHVNGHAEQLLILLEQAYPCVDLAGAVVAVYHSDERSVGSGDEVDGLVGLAERLFEHNHRERRRSGGDITCALLHGIGSYHARSSIAFGRTEGNARLQMTTGVEALGTLLGEHACSLASVQRLGQDVEQLP